MDEPDLAHWEVDPIERSGATREVGTSQRVPFALDSSRREVGPLERSRIMLGVGAS